MASRGINKVILIGNLGADPEVRYAPSGDAIANISIATSETWKDKQTGEPREKTEWHRCVAYRRLAEVMGEYLKKGSKVYVEGKLQTRKWTDTNNIERYTTEVVINEMQMLDSAQGGMPASTQQSAQGQQRQPQQQAPAQQRPSEPAPFSPDNDFDDDIPF